MSLSPKVLQWAASQVGKTYESLVDGLAKRPADRDRLLEGNITSAQAAKIASQTGVPFGFLFLKEPPQTIKPQLPDLRQTLTPAPLSQDFQEAYEDALRKQQWYLERLKDADVASVQVVGKCQPSDPALKIASDIISTLQITPELRKQAKNAESYFGLLAQRIEDLGILVMKTSIVRSNTRRSLSVKEFRGFAVADSLAPLVFINGGDAEVAAVFTLLHELAHIWIGESAISDLSMHDKSGSKIERLCNQVAADVLVPKEELQSLWAGLADVAPLALKFRVSRLVIARRALSFGWISASDYAMVAEQSQPAKVKTGGGDPYLTIPVRNSKRLTKALIESALSGETPIREAAGLLNIKPDTVMQLARKGVSNDRKVRH